MEIKRGTPGDLRTHEVHSQRLKRIYRSQTVNLDTVCSEVRATLPTVQLQNR
jgi:hypothetical protein